MRYQLAKYRINDLTLLIGRVNSNKYIALKWIDSVKSKLLKGDIEPRLYLNRDLNGTINICKQNSFDPGNMLTREELLLLEGI